MKIYASQIIGNVPICHVRLVAKTLRKAKKKIGIAGSLKKKHLGVRYYELGWQIAVK